ncbi:MAG: trimeric intracellular cation channel family protein [Geminicoccaceae bacterium]|nr:trimeric intracellular cation channel family protein [Geminicoccaceae bacterium]MCB9944526.1 trimeric intracellular cation channel family protein [Geminicoccaceae bacterium]
MFDNPVYIADLLAVAVFAASGALVASRAEMDITGFGLLSTLTGIGGGTLRDVILDRPVFWVVDALPLVVCIVLAVLVYFTAPSIQRRYPVLLWLDAVGIAFYGVLGSQIALDQGANPLTAMALGMMTATFGGMIRDVVSNEIPLILKPEIYATAALLAAFLHVMLTAFGVPLYLSGLLAGSAGFSLRALTIRKGLVLPRFHPRPGRDYP